MKNVIYQSNLTENPPIISINGIEFPNPDLVRRITAYREERLLRVMRHMEFYFIWWKYSKRRHPDEDPTACLAMELFVMSDKYDSKPVSPYQIVPYDSKISWSEDKSDYKLQRQILSICKTQKDRFDKGVNINFMNEKIDDYYREAVLNFGSFVAYQFLRISNKKLRI